jgi:hypothetical protein
MTSVGRFLVHKLMKIVVLPFFLLLRRDRRRVLSFRCSLRPLSFFLFFFLSLSFNEAIFVAPFLSLARSPFALLSVPTM